MLLLFRSIWKQIMVCLNYAEGKVIIFLHKKKANFFIFPILSMTRECRPFPSADHGDCGEGK